MFGTEAGHSELSGHCVRTPLIMSVRPRPRTPQTLLTQSWMRLGRRKRFRGESRRRVRLQATLDWLQSGVQAHLCLLVDIGLVT